MKGMGNKIKSVRELCGFTFKIPHYQRGYKWTKVEIGRLLGDIKEFMDKDGNNSATRYFIQPIMVKKDKKENTYKLVDSQQRLTTIYMIMKVLGEKPGYHLEYEKYEENGEYEKLEDIIGKIEFNDCDNAETPDEYYICRGYKAIKSWLKDNENKLDKEKFADTIKCKVYVVWYELGENEDEEEVFIRINSGKIPLTDSELIRGLLLQKKNFGNNEINRMLYSERWDKIQMRLEEDDFWYFLSGKSGNDYETRMDFVFEVMAGRKKDERYSIYQKVKENLENENIEKFWKEVEKVFSYMEYLYRNNEMYHYFGFLASTNKEMGRKLLENISKGDKDIASSKSKILNYIKSQIMGDIKCKKLKKNGRKCDKNNIIEQLLKEKELTDFISSLSYNDDKDKNNIEFILLLFNVITAIKTPGYRFPFDIYNRSKWSLEHIHPREFEGFRKNEDLVRWLCEEYKEIKEDDIKQRIKYAIQIVWNKTKSNERKNIENIIRECGDKFLESIKNVEISEPPEREINESMDTKEIGNEIFKVLDKYYKEKFGEENAQGENYINGIGNLALLQSDLNSSLKNYSFNIKRKNILNWYKKGEHFIPPATLNAFLKAYTEEPNTLHIWNAKDMEDYRRVIIEAIKGEFFKEGKENEQQQ